MYKSIHVQVCIYAIGMYAFRYVYRLTCVSVCECLFECINLCMYVL